MGILYIWSYELKWGCCSMGALLSDHKLLDVLESLSMHGCKIRDWHIFYIYRLRDGKV
jgi:hypothetical protein